MFITLSKYDAQDRQDFMSSVTAGNSTDVMHRGFLVYQEAQTYQSFSNFNGAVSAWANINGASDEKILTSDMWLANNARSKKYGRADYFFLRMQGYLIAPTSGTYRFYVQTDDGFAVRIGDNKYYVGCCPNTWDNAAQFDIVLSGVTAYEFDLFFYEIGGDSRCILGWKRPGASTVEQVPASAFGYKRVQLKKDFIY